LLVAEKSVEWRRYDDIAKIVVDIPLGGSTTVENYYEKISLQVSYLASYSLARKMKLLTLTTNGHLLGETPMSTSSWYSKGHLLLVHR